jgi:hypothetical protein
VKVSISGIIQNTGTTSKCRNKCFPFYDSIVTFDEDYRVRYSRKLLKKSEGV